MMLNVCTMLRAQACLNPTLSKIVWYVCACMVLLIIILKFSDLMIRLFDKYCKMPQHMHW